MSNACAERAGGAGEPRRRTGLIILGSLLLGPLAGCAMRRPPPIAAPARQQPAEAPQPLIARLLSPDPTRLDLQISTDAELNPDARGRSSPLLLRLYELAGPAQFEAADFMALFEREREVLGADLLGREEWILPPASLRSLQRQAAAGARHLGVLAAYRDLERARWRLLVPLQPSQPNRLRIRASARTLGLADLTAADGMPR